MAYKQQKFISHSSGGWEVQDHVPTAPVSGEDPSPGLQTVTFSPGPHLVESRDKQALWHLFAEGLSSHHEGSTLLT